MDSFSREFLERELFSNIPDIQGKKIIIYGMGNTACLYQEGFERLAPEGFYVDAYCDSDSEKLKKEKFCGKPVVRIEDLVGQKNICILICTPVPEFVQEIAVRLKAYELPYYLLDEVIIKQHAAEVLKCYDLLADEESKKVYADIILSHIQGRYPKAESCTYGNAYFALNRFKGRNRPEIFVDCGSYVGETVEQYIWSRDGVFDKIVAFEPDKDNYAAMVKRINRLKEEWNFKADAIQLFPYGVADRNGEMIFESHGADNGLGSKFVMASGEEDSGGKCNRVVSLDEQIPYKYTFLKADIESYEYKMIAGAKMGIQNNRPLLAICIYHNAVDLYSIPLFIQSLVKEYHMAVRHHSNTLLETVLYCWCD